MIPSHVAIANNNLLPPANRGNEIRAVDPTTSGKGSEVRQAFDAFVGETFFSQLLGAMRKSVGKSPYFHGGRAEDVFRGQLDQVLAEKIAESTAQQFSGPMFEMFQLQRR